MGKRRSWFTFVKRLFIPETKPTAEKKPKRWRCFFGRYKLRKCPAIAPPAEKTLSEAKEEQRKHALAVAIATAAAADAAIAAANAAAHVIRLTNAPNEFKRERINAAIKIQSAFRAHLAKKALSALKGIVKLQAVVRGEIVRNRLISRLKCMLPLQNSKPKVYQIRLPSLEDYHDSSDKKRLIDSTKELKFKCKSHRTWNFNLASEEDTEALWSTSDEAIHKREHLMKYSFSHRERRKDRTLQELLSSKHNRRSCRFDQLAGLEAPRKAEYFEQLRSYTDSNIHVGDMSRITQVNVRKLHRPDCTEDLHSPSSLPRRSFSNVKRKSNVEVNSLPSSPIFPTYMAATESAKAKTRSMSTPKQHLRLHETYSGQYSPYKSKLSSFGSEWHGEMNGRTRKS